MYFRIWWPTSRFLIFTKYHERTSRFLTCSTAFSIHFFHGKIVSKAPSPSAPPSAPPERRHRSSGNLPLKGPLSTSGSSSCLLGFAWWFQDVSNMDQLEGDWVAMIGTYYSVKPHPGPLRVGCRMLQENWETGSNNPPACFSCSHNSYDFYLGKCHWIVGRFVFVLSWKNIPHATDWGFLQIRGKWDFAVGSIYTLR